MEKAREHNTKFYFDFVNLSKHTKASPIVSGLLSRFKVCISGGSRISKRGGRAKRAAKFGPAHILYINGARARPSHEQNRTRTSELAKFRGGI